MPKSVAMKDFVTAISASGSVGSKGGGVGGDGTLGWDVDRGLSLSMLS